MHNFENFLSLPYFPGWIYGVEFRTHTHAFIVNSHSTVCLVDTSEGDLIELGDHEEVIWSLSLNTNDNIVASGSADKSIKLWNLSEKKLVKTLAINKDPIRAVKFSEDGKILASGGEAKYKDQETNKKLVRIYIWDWEHGEVEHIFYGHEGYIRRIEFFSDDRYVVSLDNRGIINIWDIEKKTLSKRFEIDCLDFAISRDEKYLITSGNLGVQFWDLQTKKCIKTFADEGDGTGLFSYSPADNLLAVNVGKQVRVFDYPSGAIRGSIDISAQYIGFSHDGMYLALGDPSGEYAVGEYGICLSIWRVPQELWLKTEIYPVFKMPHSITEASKASSQISNLQKLPPKPEPPEIGKIPHSLSKERLEKELQETKLTLSRAGLSLAVLSFLISLILPGGFIVFVILLLLWLGASYVNGGLQRRKIRKELLIEIQNEKKLIEVWDQDRKAKLDQYDRRIKEWTIEWENIGQDQIDVIEGLDEQDTPVSPFVNSNRSIVRGACQILQPQDVQFYETSPTALRGYAEVKSQFPSMLKHFFGDNKILEMKKVLGKVPDFIYYDGESNLAIDIEIDEPYTPRQYPGSFPKKELKLTHCMDQPGDEERDQILIDNDWFVIRFSEAQIFMEPAGCCKYIAEQIDYLSGTSYSGELVHVPLLGIDYRWTKSDARCQAQARTRLKYS